MLSIHPTNPQKCTPNLLPARINHNGPIPATQRYWKPCTDEKGNHHAYLRGRHLHGTSLALPSNYTGAVINVTDKQVPPPSPPSSSKSNEDIEDEDAQGDEDMEVTIAEQIGVFDEIMIWGHGGEVDGAQDAYVRGMEEWVGWTESMHGDERGDEEGGEGDTKGKGEGKKEGR